MKKVKIVDALPCMYVCTYYVPPSDETDPMSSSDYNQTRSSPFLFAFFMLDSFSLIAISNRPFRLILF